MPAALLVYFTVSHLGEANRHSQYQQTRKTSWRGGEARRPEPITLNGSKWSGAIGFPLKVSLASGLSGPGVRVSVLAAERNMGEVGEGETAGRKKGLRRGRYRREEGLEEGRRRGKGNVDGGMRRKNWEKVEGGNINKAWLLG